MSTCTHVPVVVHKVRFWNSLHLIFHSSFFINKTLEEGKSNTPKWKKFSFFLHGRFFVTTFAAAFTEGACSGAPVWLGWRNR